MLRLAILSVAILFTHVAIATEPPADVVACCHCGEDLSCDACNDDGGCQDASCCEGCFSSVEPGTKEKHCWNVECNKICIPAIRFPWEAGGSPLTCFSWLKNRGNNCCDTCGSSCTGTCDTCCVKPLCGEVRCVRDLVKEKYEVDTCEWNWQIRRLPACEAACGKCCEDGGE